MLTSHEEEIRKLMGAFFHAGGVKRYKGPVSDAVVAVFIKMLLDAQHCLNDASWAYRPDPDDPPISAMLSQVSMSFIERLARLNEDHTCIEFAIERYMDELKRAIIASQ